MCSSSGGIRIEAASIRRFRSSHGVHPTIANIGQLWATHGLFNRRRGAAILRCWPCGVAGQRLLLGLAVASVHVESYGRVDLCGGEIRWSIEVDVEWKVELVLEGIDFESAKRLVGCDLGTLALPPWRGFEIGSSLLESVEKESGAAVIDAVIGDGVDDLLNAGLHGVHVVENRHLEVRAGLAVQTRVRSLHAASASVEVEVAITLIAKSGRTAVDAIFLGMVASTV